MANSEESAPQKTTETPDRAVRSLEAAIREVRSREADQNDVVVDLKAAERSRLALLADELRPLLSEIDETDERFEFALTNGERPRLWIDMTSFVAMGHDKRSYRFLKDTRIGRVVLSETEDMLKTADIISGYVAEKVLERERVLEGEWIAIKESPIYKGETVQTKPSKAPRKTPSDNAPPAAPAPRPSMSSTLAQATSDVKAEKKSNGVLKSILWFSFGAICAVALAAASYFYLIPSAL